MKVFINTNRKRKRATNEPKNVLSNDEWSGGARPCAGCRWSRQGKKHLQQPTPEGDRRHRHAIFLGTASRPRQPYRATGGNRGPDGRAGENEIQPRSRSRGAAGNGD